MVPVLSALSRLPATGGWCDHVVGIMCTIVFPESWRTLCMALAVDVSGDQPRTAPRGWLLRIPCALTHIAM